VPRFRCHRRRQALYAYREEHWHQGRV